MRTRRRCSPSCCESRAPPRAASTFPAGPLSMGARSAAGLPLRGRPTGAIGRAPAVGCRPRRQRLWLPRTVTAWPRNAAACDLNSIARTSWPSEMTMRSHFSWLESTREVPWRFASGHQGDPSQLRTRCRQPALRAPQLRAAGHLAARSGIDLAGLNLLCLVLPTCVPITLDCRLQSFVDIDLAAQASAPRAALSSSDKL